MNKFNKAELLSALKLAVDEAEAWFDDSRGLNDDERVDALESCYAILKAAGIKTEREADALREKPAEFVR